MVILSNLRIIKHSCFTVLLTVLISMVGAQAFSQICIIEYDGLYYSVDDNQGTARLVNIEEEFPDLMNTIYPYDAPSGDIVIPEEILVPAYDDYTYTHSFNTISVIEGDFLGWYFHNSFQVISIGQAFRENGAIKSVTIPSSITSIGDEAFEGCNGLTSVNFGDGVKSIGNSAFKRCSSLLSVVIPYGVTSIGDDAFWNCYSLTSVYIPCSVTNIGDDAFKACI